jgi:hypothetical protein
MISTNGQMMDTEKAKFRLEGRKLLMQGTICRMAEVEGEGYKSLVDPASAITALRSSNT